MKLLLALIQPPKLETVLQALRQIGVERVTVADTQGYGRQRGQTELYRGREYSSQLLRKIALEIEADEQQVERITETIQSAARTGPEGSFGDGKIFVLPCEAEYAV